MNKRKVVNLMSTISGFHAKEQRYIGFGQLRKQVTKISSKTIIGAVVCIHSHQGLE